MSDQKIETIENINQKRLESYAAARKRTKTANLIFDIIIYIRKVRICHIK